jgi:hypothetical protein
MDDKALELKTTFVIYLAFVLSGGTGVATSMSSRIH